MTHTINNIRLEIRFAGLQRSGNHAVINWILKQSGKYNLFFNDVDPDNPYDLSYLHNSSSTINLSGDYDCVIYSYEDRLLDLLTDKRYYPKNNIYHINVEQRIDIIILRNPFNLFASRFKHNTVPGNKSAYISGLNTSQLWITYAREFLGNTNKLSNKKVCINYDTWCDSVEYRKQIANELGFDFTDTGFKDVNTFGSGSSFDQASYRERANEMKTSQRWKHYSNNEEFINMMNNNTLIDLTCRIFTPEPELIDFINSTVRKRKLPATSILGSINLIILPKFYMIARHSVIGKFLYGLVASKNKS